jgi:hypothetical protein
MTTNKEQRFKHGKLTERKCINSIVRFYELATHSELREGMEWYTQANDYCKELAGRFGISLQQSAGIIAAFSPQAGWIENKRYAVSFLINPKNRLRSLVQDKKAKKILRLKGEDEIYHALAITDAAYKTKSFFLNILNPDVALGCTIDRHAIAVCIQSPDNVFALDKSYTKPTRVQYNFFQTCYCKAALKLDILPQQLQAITWIVYRRLRDLRTHDESNHWKPFQTDVEF